MITRNGNKEESQIDANLVASTLQDPDKYELLIKKYELRLLRYIQKLILVNKEDAEDILQEAFIKAYKNLNGYNPKFSFSSWIYRIAHNEAISFTRQKNNKLKAAMSVEEDVFNTIASEVDLEGDILQYCTKKRVYRVLNQLDKKYREVLVLKYIEEMDYSEISDVLHKSSGTVASLISRGKIKFQELIEKQ